MQFLADGSNSRNKDWIRLLNLWFSHFTSFQGLTMVCSLILCNGCEQKQCLTDLSLAASIKSLFEHGLHS